MQIAAQQQQQQKTAISYFLLFICLRLAATTKQLFDLADVYERKNVRIARNSNTMNALLAACSTK